MPSSKSPPKDIRGIAAMVKGRYAFYFPEPGRKDPLEVKATTARIAHRDFAKGNMARDRVLPVKCKIIFTKTDEITFTNSGEIHFIRIGYFYLIPNTSPTKERPGAISPTSIARPGKAAGRRFRAIARGGGWRRSSAS